MIENYSFRLYSNDEIANELGVSRQDLRRLLLDNGILEIRDGIVSLTIDHIDWAVIGGYEEGMKEQHLSWTTKGHDNILKTIPLHENTTSSIEYQYSTDKILTILGIPMMLFQKRLVNHRIAKYSTGNIVLRNKFKDWGRLEQIPGTNKYQFMWCQEGFEGILNVFDSDKLINFSLEEYYKTMHHRTYSYVEIAKELGISYIQLRKFLVEKGILLSIQGKAAKSINPIYHDWIQLSPDDHHFRWTNSGRDNIIQLYKTETGIVSSKNEQKDDVDQHPSGSLIINSEESSFFSSEKIAKELGLTIKQLREFLVAQKVVRSMRGKIGVFQEYADWGCFMPTNRGQEKSFVWTRKGKERIVELYRSKDKAPAIDTQKKVQILPQLQINTSQLQRTFKTKYVDQLLEQAKSGETLSQYALDVFPIEEENVLYIPSIVHPVGLLEKMNPAIEKDFESAVALYEAYPNLSPLQASDKSFWIYLAHTELFPYVQNRYPEVLANDFHNSKYVLDHWFFGEGVLNHALAGLWWAVYFSVNEENTEHKYDCTQFIFSRDSNFRNNLFVNYLLFRHKEATLGILQFLMEDKELCLTFFRKKISYIIKYFNKLGGTRQLVSLDRDFFYQELKRIRPQIMAIPSDEDVKNSK